MWLAAGGVGAAAALAGWVITKWLVWTSQRHTERLTRLSDVELVELFLFVDPRLFLKLNATALVLLPPLGFLTLGWLGGVWIAVLVLVAPSLIYRTLRVRRMRCLETQLPDVATAIAASLRSGLALGQALDQVVRHQPRPAAQEFALMLREHRIGLTLDTALENLAGRNESRDLSLLVSTLGVARDLGGGLAEALERFASAARRRLALEERIRALTAQGRLQGWIMGALPLVVALALGSMEPSFFSMLFNSPVGWATLTLIVTLEGAGYLLIRRIVRIEV